MQLFDLVRSDRRDFLGVDVVLVEGLQVLLGARVKVNVLHEVH